MYVSNSLFLSSHRHFYALAAEPRCLRGLDVDAASASDVFVPIEMTLRDQRPGEVEPRLETRRAMTPCLLPAPQQLVSLRVCGNRYWGLELGARDPFAGQ